MTSPLIHTAFAAGEITPELFARVDLAKFGIAASTMRNMYVDVHGGANSRAGTAYIAISQTPVSSGYQPRLIPFRFSRTQQYVLEIGYDGTTSYIAFYFDGFPITEAAKNISGASQASPCVLTVPGHGWTTGDRISVASINGMWQLNNRLFIVTVLDPDNVSLSMLNGLTVDSSAFSAYVSGGQASRLYRIDAPWSPTDFPLLKFTQSADVMTITHSSYQPYELTRISSTNWTLDTVDFSPVLSRVTDLGGEATVHPDSGLSPPTLPAAYAYVVTAVDQDGNESDPSNITNVEDSVDMAVTAGSIVLNWTNVTGAAYYNIYRSLTSYNTDPGNPNTALAVPVGATFFFVGKSFGSTFVDSNITPDFTRTPPVFSAPFSPGRILGAYTPGAPGSGYTTATVSISTSTGNGGSIIPVIYNTGIWSYYIQNSGENYDPADTASVSGDGSGAAVNLVIGPTSGTYPGVVAYFQQRIVYGNTPNQPDTYFMSKPGQYHNFSVSQISQADDSIIGTPWAQQVDGIQWMLQEPAGLLVFTGGGMWQVGGIGSSAQSPAAITPTSQQAQPQFFSGISSVVPPSQIYSDVLFVTAMGNSVRGATYNYLQNNWSGSDLTVLSGHLFLYWDVREWAWSQEPYKIMWTVRCDGVLLSLTYLKEQEIYGWARHDTNGSFVSVTSVSEPPVDAVYVIVLRATPNGQFYMIERFNDHIWQTTEDPWCVDAGLGNFEIAYDTPLTASSLTGAVTFTSPTAIFNSVMVGAVLRISGGIALLTGFTSSTEMTGTWYLSPSFASQAYST